MQGGPVGAYAGACPLADQAGVIVCTVNGEV